MLFNSYFFVFIYLPVVLTAFFTCCYFQLKKAAQISLLLSSLFFYAYWDIRFLPLLVGSIAFNFWIGNQIYRTGNKAYVIFGIASNLALLFYFKYLNFFISSSNALFSSDMSLIEIVFPLGISFFTFTQIAYLVDVYQQKALPGNWSSYGLFVTVFPHLIAGPVLHHKEMMTQFDDTSNYRWSSQNFAEAIFLFVIGMTKKVLIADNIVPFVSSVFDGHQTHTPFIQAWVGSIAYSIQLYFDFSGYSDMAVGLGLFFNLRLPINFNSPYQATSMIDFWKRWHISLSNFLRDYLYIPLGGNRNGETSKLLNLVITMLLGGIWHGAGWTFIIWGLCHGFLLIINHLWRKLHIALPNTLCRLLTLFCVIITFAIFRSANLSVASDIMAGLFGFNGFVLPTSYEQHLGFLKDFGVIFKTLAYSNVKIKDLLAIMACLLIACYAPNSNLLKQRFLERPIASGTFCAIAFVACIINLDAVSEFLYYQF
jgi:alginate O-acetyltransferase complex protein AlgI